MKPSTQRKTSSGWEEIDGIASRFCGWQGRLSSDGIGDVASKVPDQVILETSEVPWAKVRGMRIIVDHVYHAVDYNIVWETLRNDVPELWTAIERWRSLHPEIDRDTGMEGPGIGL